MNCSAVESLAPTRMSDASEWVKTIWLPHTSTVPDWPHPHERATVWFSLAHFHRHILYVLDVVKFPKIWQGFNVTMVTSFFRSQRYLIIATYSDKRRWIVAATAIFWLNTLSCCFITVLISVILPAIWLKIQCQGFRLTLH